MPPPSRKTIAALIALLGLIPAILLFLRKPTPSPLPHPPLPIQNASIPISHPLPSPPALVPAVAASTTPPLPPPTPTGHDFKLNHDGTLREAPTLRLQALDALARTNLPAAAALARQLLQTKSSPDEWALSLAIIARSDNSDETRQFIAQKAEEMALYQPWLQNPSTGFLEAFDLFVYTDDTAFTPTLANITNDKSNPVAAHAAFLALDRLAQISPPDTLQSLLDDPSLLDTHPATQAGLFARADPRDPAQQQILSQYLLSPARSPQELDAFAGLFPNENFIISDNLLTQNATPSGDEIRARYQAAQQLVSQWQSDPNFATLQPRLAKIQNRLQRVLGVASQ